MRATRGGVVVCRLGVSDVAICAPCGMRFAWWGRSLSLLQADSAGRLTDHRARAHALREGVQPRRWSAALTRAIAFESSPYWSAAVIRTTVRPTSS
jgi:hypothetical protein